MAPNNNQFTGVLNENDAQTTDGGLLVDVTELKHAEKRQIILNWRNISLFALVHLQAVYGLWLIFTSARLYTFVFGKTMKGLSAGCTIWFNPLPLFAQRTSSTSYPASASRPAAIDCGRIARTRRAFRCACC